MVSELAVSPLWVGQVKMSGLKPTNATRRRGTPAAGPTVPLLKRKPQAQKHGWSYKKFGLEMGRARRIGLTIIDNNHLLNLAEGAYGVYKRCVVDISDVVIEVWRRIENYDLPEVNNSKTQFCNRRLGCSLRWGESIVSGDARNPNRAKTKEKRREVNPPDLELPEGTDEDIATKMVDGDFRELQPLRTSELWSRYQKICRIAGTRLLEASEIPNPWTKITRDAAAD
jgi:hypothetical protein